MPPYQTIVLEMLRERRPLYRQLAANRTLLQSVEQLALALKSCHLQWMQQLAQSRAGSAKEQLSSEALEMALHELQDSLPPISPASDTEALSLDAAMVFLQRHMPAG